MNMRHLFLIITVLSLAGCPRIARVGLYEVEKNLKEDFEKMGYVTLSGLISEDRNVQQEDEKYIRKQQCLFKRANPLLISCMDRMDLSLKGIITASGEIRVAGQPEGILGMEGILGVSSQTEQTIPFPVTIVSLGAVPDLYLTSTLGDLDKCKDTFRCLEKTEQKKILGEIYSNYEKLKKRVEDLQKTFDRSDCPNKCDQ